MTREATVLIVLGLRDHVPEHWQTELASRLSRVRTVVPLGCDNLNCRARVHAIEQEAAKIVPGWTSYQSKRGNVLASQELRERKRWTTKPAAG
jgi:hypothetical protein